MPRGENEKDRGTHGEQPPPRTGPQRERGKGGTRLHACVHTCTPPPPPDTEDARERQKKKKKKKTKRLFDCVTQALGCGMWDLVP